MPDSELSFATWDELCSEMNNRTDTLVVIGVLKSEPAEISTYFAGRTVTDMLSVTATGFQSLVKRLEDEDDE